LLPSIYVLFSFGLLLHFRHLKGGGSKFVFWVGAEKRELHPLREIERNPFVSVKKALEAGIHGFRGGAGGVFNIYPPLKSSHSDSPAREQDKEMCLIIVYVSAIEHPCSSHYKRIQKHSLFCHQHNDKFSLGFPTVENFSLSYFAFLLSWFLFLL
jgi:hypothetical protein